jgi:hypothetical protein
MAQAAMAKWLQGVNLYPVRDGRFSENFDFFVEMFLISAIIAVN